MTMQSTAATIENKRNRVIITAAVMLATFMQALDSTIANVALPHIQGSLSGTQDEMTWVLTSYIVAAAITIPLTGWLAGVMGRKKVLLVSITGFVVTSILCGVAQDLPEMVVFRFLQGVSGAALVPLSQSILLSINPKENYGKAMAVWGLGVTMGPIIGPLLGGYLTQNYDWRWVFYINVPIGFLAFAGLYFFFKETETQTKKFDFFGFFALSLGIGALQIMLDRGELKDWFGSTEIIVEALLATVGFYWFFVHTWTYPQPFINPALFRDRNFSVATLLIFVLGIVLFAALALMPPMLQNQLNYPVFTTGIVTAPRGVGIMVAMMLVGRLLEYIDARYVIAIGLSITAFSLWQMTYYSLQTDVWAIIFPGLIQGFGIGFSYIALTSAAFSYLPQTLQNEGTSFFNLMRNLGSSIGISIVTTLLTRNTQTMHATLSTYITPYNPLANLAITANHINLFSIPGLASLNAMVSNQAMMVSYIDDYYFMMLLTLFFIPSILFLRASVKKEKDIAMVGE